ncbi:hypothetical protein LOTGIDRAFT_228774 [Lottia gigantea]|uniref:Kinesin-like protein n=1 Tax=Lottia gigantea TaxID=225164 RepID=V3ZJ11_LOTGI|nr:hypothetical protein LOTGIDRAFT_228774 [Lottia gigantea]ESO91298.1 hypothetical protein LOTGIDRAFT_228774 [Lottia gigantea]
MGNSASVKDKKNKGSTITVAEANTKQSPGGVKNNMEKRTAPQRGGKFQEVHLKKSADHKSDNLGPNKSQADKEVSSSPRSNSKTAKENAAVESYEKKAQSRDKNTTAPTEGDEIVFETFIMNDGREFQCLYTGGIRFYLDDWHSKEWQPFPHRWYNEGRFVTGNILADNNQQQSNSSNQQGRSTEQVAEDVQQSRKDDREGTIHHPKRGTIRTYLFKEKHYVHCFFDPSSGEWMRLPLGWELQHPLVKEMVGQVEEALPNWKNRPHILAALRVCNYNPDECISLYLHLENDEWLNPPKTSQEENKLKARDLKVKELDKKVQSLEVKLKNEEKLRKDAEAQVLSLQEKLSDLEAKSGMAVAQVEAMQQTRPRTARPKTPKDKKPQGCLSLEELDSLNTKTTEIHKCHAQFKLTVERQLEALKTMILQANETAKKLGESDVGHMKELEEIRSLYQRESLQRKLLYNQLQELRGNIRVFCRPRRDDKVQPCLTFPTDNELMCSNSDGNKKTFSFDKVFKTTATQEEVFADTKPVITSCADGYNICLIAYGQTGSGKTYTMMGPEKNPGINIRALTELLDICEKRADVKVYEMKISIVEIYNEAVIDLLVPNGKTVELKASGTNFRIPGLTEVPIRSVDEIKQVMKTGDENRSVASTKMNSTSSRSHLILMLTIEGKDKVNGAISKGMLTLCDLAGSERIGKTEASGQRLVEAAAINKSLSALGQVFSALRTSQMHIPYRNSKLTQILRPCLGGDAKACVFVNISPDVTNYPETCNTLEFGSNARQVALGQAKQNVKRMRD